MYMMRKDGLIVFHTARERLERIRKDDTRFKGAHIKEGLQLFPSRIELGAVYEEER